jgi:hypothetical protein
MNDTQLNNIIPSVVMLSVFILSVVMLSVIMLSVAMLSDIMLSVIMLSVSMLSVVAPLRVEHLVMYKFPPMFACIKDSKGQML